MISPAALFHPLTPLEDSLRPLTPLTPLRCVRGSDADSVRARLGCGRATVKISSGEVGPVQWGSEDRAPRSLPVLGGFYSRVAFPVVLNAERVAETCHEYKKRGSAKNLTGVVQKITESSR